MLKYRLVSGKKAFMQKGFRINMIFSALVCLLITAVAGADLTARVNAVIGGKSCKKVDIALKIVEASTGRCVYRRNADKSMIPASNMKLLTSAAAIDFLQSEHQNFPLAELVTATFPLAAAEEAFEYTIRERALRVAVVPEPRP